MHTNENRNKRKGIPGQQVQDNKAMHCNMQLFENEAGEYYPVVDRMEQPTLVRGEYIPIGNRFHYPKRWGRKYAAVKLIEHKIEIEKNIIASAESELEKLKRCLDAIGDWSDTDE